NPDIMDRRELRNYVDMPHFHPEKNVVNGIDLYKNGRHIHEIRHEFEKNQPLRIRTYSTGSQEEVSTPVGSPSTPSGSLSSIFRWT
uniref:Uncharacterized protein n=1 Tax=Magallana gigas TaxID=29159 RepID=A0A8W8KIT4_MAGGI